MKPRRSARLRRMDALYRQIQRIRLERIADRLAEPLSPREHYFLWTLKTMGHVDYDDFIVSGLLFMAETEEMKVAAEREAAAIGEPPPADVTAS
ncbi:hypothetical protein [Brevundimonas sp.]|uniref:hypothetical protein n=1 Tax=Brevundimonas sp. TaxID=1871086 RepID=UPI002FC695E6